MHVKVITNKNGSILGKIPIRMSETPRPEADRNAEARTNYRSSWWPSSRMDPIAFVDESRNRNRARVVEVEDIELEERERPTRQSNRGERPRRTRENDRTGHSSQHGGYWFRGSSIRSLVKGFLGLELPEDESTNRRHNSLAEGQAFFPDPMISFLIDRPKDLLCQICQTTTLSIGPLSHSPDEHTPAILPCGHLACHTCLNAWVSRNKNCPFCRKEMKYSGCGHTLTPALITHDSIATLPKTIPRGGIIGQNCRGCRDKENKENAYILWGIAANGVRMSRQAPPGTDPSDARRMEEIARELFESVPDRFTANNYLDRNTW
ncbi:hypothetical protein K445DRAFT_24986 [Daldinia sp. EC12]|nr:hypothetical protein K445DRAFT_24986 [Daldinia sp. EC12]